MSNFKVLMVDDEVELVSTLAERLQLRGISTQTAIDGESALKIISENKPEIIVLDLMMPGLGGIETLKRIKSENPKQHVIVLTGYSTEQQDEQLADLGAFCSLQKPCKIDNLIKMINDALESNKND